jgi:oligopeptide transport system substrate-binding protein
MLIVLILALLVPRFSLGSAAQTGEKILNVQQSSYPDVVDPQKSSFTNELDILALIYEGLTRIDEHQQTVPAAAESWDYNADATQITFHLQKGLTYSDGSPLVAENFRYAVERTCGPNTAGGYQSILFVVVGCAAFAGLTVDATGAPREYTAAEYDTAKAALGVRALDDLTLQIDLTKPTPYFHTLAYTWVFFPVKQAIVAKDPDNWWKTPANHLGNGPFTVTRIDEIQRWTFAANDHYRLGRPTLDGIEFVYVGDPAVALQAYRAGDLDIVGVAATTIDEVKADPALSAQLLNYPLAGTIALGMSLRTAPFDDPKVRQAFAYAFDRQTFCAELWSGTCQPTLSWIPPGTPGAIETDQFAFDPEKATQALADSTFGGPETLPAITLTYNSDDPNEVQRAEWVAGQYRDILGITLTVAPLDGTTLASRMKDATTYPQLLMYNGWFQDYPDPQNWLSLYWTCDSSFAKPIGYCNHAFDQLVEQGDTTVDPTARLPYYDQAGQLLVDDVPGVFLNNPVGLFLVKPNVTGLPPTASADQWPGQYVLPLTINITNTELATLTVRPSACGRPHRPHHQTISAPPLARLQPISGRQPCHRVLPSPWCQHPHDSPSPIGHTTRSRESPSVA